MTEKMVSYSSGNSYAVIHNPSEDNHATYRKSFYLRTGNSTEEIVSQAEQEFTEEDVNFEFNTGAFEVTGDMISVSPLISLGLTHLVAEALFYKGMVEMDETLSAVRTIRQPSLKVYNHLRFGVTEIEESDESLFDLLTNPEQPARISITGVDPHDEFMHSIRYGNLARGFPQSRPVVMNYGYIAGSRASFIVDGKYTSPDAKWYVLPNDILSLDSIKRCFSDSAKLGTISRSLTHDFDEADKVTEKVGFDGTLRDLVSVLIEGGIKLDPSLSLDDFSDR
jgi:hypothetical protein